MSNKRNKIVLKLGIELKNKSQQLTNCNMAGGGFSGLTSRTLRPPTAGLTRFLPEIPPDHIQVTVTNKTEKSRLTI